MVGKFCDAHCRVANIWIFWSDSEIIILDCAKNGQICIDIMPIGRFEDWFKSDSKISQIFRSHRSNDN